MSDTEKNDVTSNWPEYRSHKVVRAVKIVSISPDGLTYADAAASVPVAFTPDPKLFARGMASLGDWLVAYDDGYISWSPAKAFEEGYSLNQQANLMQGRPS